MAQSISSCSTIAARRCSWGSSRGCGVKPSGMSSWESMIRLMVSAGMAVGTAAWSAGASLTAGLVTAPGSAGWPTASLVSVKARSSSDW